MSNLSIIAMSIGTIPAIITAYIAHCLASLAIERVSNSRSSDFECSHSIASEFTVKHEAEDPWRKL